MEPGIGAAGIALGAVLLASACGRTEAARSGESTTTAATVTAQREGATVAPPAPPPPARSPDARAQVPAPGAPTAPGPNDDAIPSTPRAAPGAPTVPGAAELGARAPREHASDLVDRGPLVPKGLNPPPTVGGHPARDGAADDPSLP